MDHIVNMHEAKTQLSSLVALAQQGKSVTIAVRVKPAVRLVPVNPQPKPGLMKDKWPPVPWSSFAPMSDDEAIPPCRQPPAPRPATAGTRNT